MMTEDFTRYEIGLEKLLRQVDKDNPHYTEVETLRARLLDNISQTRRYGNTETRRAEKAQIVDRLNQLALETVGVSLLDIYTPLLDEPKVDYVEFINRVEKIEKVFLEVNDMQCWVVDAPAGYGKSRFIQKIKERYEDKSAKWGWACCYIKIQRERPPDLVALGQQILVALGTLDQGSCNLQKLSAEGIGIKVADVLRQMTVQFGQRSVPICNTSHKGVAVFLDNVEVLDDQTFADLADIINGIYLGLKETDFFIRSNQLRVFLAGRDIRRRSNVFRSRGRSYKDFTLSPYTFQFVEDAVREYILKADLSLESSSRYSDIAARFMYFNGGHPGCIAETLTQLRHQGIPMVRKLLRQEDIYRAHSFQVLADLEKDNKDISKLLQILETLSVFRSFGPWLLEKLIDKGYIDWEGDIYQLSDKLMSTYLLHREKAFIRDNITQRLFATRLRYHDPERFKDLCEVGTKVYWRRLCSKHSYPEQLALEYLYQKLQYAYHVEGLSGEELIDYIQSTLDKVMKKMTEERDIRDVYPHFFQLLEEDWELEFLTNYYINDENYDRELYRKTLQDFEQELNITNL
jgi:hypothetical protein